MLIHIHAPKPDAKFIHAGKCPDCGKWSRFIGTHTPWYGSHKTCLRCGREWADGEWVPLPFVRGARAKNIESAKRHWRALKIEEPPHDC